MEFCLPEYIKGVLTKKIKIIISKYSQKKCLTQKYLNLNMLEYCCLCCDDNITILQYMIESKNMTKQCILKSDGDKNCIDLCCDNINLSKYKKFKYLIKYFDLNKNDILFKNNNNYNYYYKNCIHILLFSEYNKYVKKAILYLIKRFNINRNDFYHIYYNKNILVEYCRKNINIKPFKLIIKLFSINKYDITHTYGYNCPTVIVVCIINNKYSFLKYLLKKYKFNKQEIINYNKFNICTENNTIIKKILSYDYYLILNNIKKNNYNKIFKSIY